MSVQVSNCCCWNVTSSLELPNLPLFYAMVNWVGLYSSWYKCLRSFRPPDIRHIPCSIHVWLVRCPFSKIFSCSLNTFSFPKCNIMTCISASTVITSPIGMMTAIKIVPESRTRLYRIPCHHCHQCSHVVEVCHRILDTGHHILAKSISLLTFLNVSLLGCSFV